MCSRIRFKMEGLNSVLVSVLVTVFTICCNMNIVIDGATLESTHHPDTVPGPDTTTTTTTTVTIDAPCGQILGSKEFDDQTGSTFMSFSNIPYAKPPLGPLRFAKPQPHPPFEKTFDATKKEFIFCPNPSYIIPLKATEACLILNIQMKGVPTDLKGDKEKKVLVFIHGGGFFAGASFDISAKSFVLEQDVIVVTLNYRLGVLGFLSTEDDASPGNYGLWDQVLAIQWVKNNIRAFGGDPDDVTISGQSAGGASVNYLSLSPHTNGLFTKGYIQSSTATAPFARATQPRADAISLAKTVGCFPSNIDNTTSMNLEDSKSMVECLRDAPVGPFTNVMFGEFTDHFVPCVDGDLVPDLPLKLLQNESYLQRVGFFDRSYLVAMNDEDPAGVYGSLQFMKQMIFKGGSSVSEKREAYKQFISNTEKLQIRRRLGPEIAACNDSIVDNIKDIYSTRYARPFDFTNLVGDLTYIISSYDVLTAAAKRPSCKSYFLYFAYHPSYMNGSGMIHAGELPYLFDYTLEELDRVVRIGLKGNMSGKDLEMKAMFSSVIGQFVRTGNPGEALKTVLPSGWPRYDESSSPYLNLSLNPWVGSNLKEDRRHLWLETVPRLMRRYSNSNCTHYHPPDTTLISPDTTSADPPNTTSNPPNSGRMLRTASSTIMTSTAPVFVVYLMSYYLMQSY